MASFFSQTTFGRSMNEVFDIPSSSTRVNIVQYLIELLNDESEDDDVKLNLIRTKLASIFKQAKSVDQFASLVSEFVMEQSVGYSKEAIHSRILQILNEISVAAWAVGTTVWETKTRQDSSTTGAPKEIISYGQVTRATEFNSQVFETLVERNTRLGKAIKENSTLQLLNNEEIMQQYQDCNKLAKLWIMQELSEFKVCNEWKDNLLLADLPFDIKFEIISFIPIEGCKAWWAQYLRFRVISNSIKQRLERTMFSKITREGISLSSVTMDEQQTQAMEEFLNCHADFEKSKLEGREFSGNLLRNTETKGFVKNAFNGREILPHDDKVIPPKERMNDDGIDTSLLFDKDYNEKVINEISNSSKDRYTPFEKHVYSEGDIIPKQIFTKPKFVSTPTFGILTKLQNPYIKQLVVKLTQRQMYWLKGLTGLEELTVLIDFADFRSYIESSFCMNSLSNKFKQFNIVIYGKFDFTPAMILLLMEKTLDFGGVLTIYADMDDQYLSPFNDPSFEMSVFRLDKPINSSIDFKDLKLVLKPIQEFSVTKEILENGWYRPVKQSAMKKSPHQTEPEKIMDPIFGCELFDIHQKKELIKCFANYDYPFEWDKSKTQLDEAFVQYYLHLLNANQKRLNYSGSINPCCRSRKLLDIIVWGYDITICPETIFDLCTIFGNIGVRLTIEKLKTNPNYINIHKFQTLIHIFNNSTMVMYYLVQLIPYIQNSENLDMLEIVDNQPELLTSFILENYANITYLESENKGASKFIDLLQSSDIPNFIIERLARKYPSLLYQKSSFNNQTPLHYCFTNKKRYLLIKPFIEIAPETINYEDKYGYKPYHLIPEYLDNDTKLTNAEFGLDFFQNHILPASVNHILGKKF